jgi:hypothetical protein
LVSRPRFPATYAALPAVVIARFCGASSLVSQAQPVGGQRRAERRKTKEPLGHKTILAARAETYAGCLSRAEFDNLRWARVDPHRATNSGGRLLLLGSLTRRTRGFRHRLGGVLIDFAVLEPAA